MLVSIGMNGVRNGILASSFSFSGNFILVKSQPWKIYVLENYKEKIMILKIIGVFVLIYISNFSFKFKLFFFKMWYALKFELIS